MRYKLLILGFFFCSSSFAVPVERDAIINDDLKNNSELYSQIANLIRAYGYRCDSLSGLHPMLLSRGFSVSCNNFSYSYEIEDKGGNWVVTLD